MRLTRAMIFVKDLPRMEAFYAGTLGLKPVEATRLNNWVEFAAGPAGFSLHAIPGHIARQIQIATPPQPREQTALKLSFEVDDIVAERERLKSLGVTILERPWGACEVVDPEGNIFGIYAASGDHAAGTG